MSVRGTAGVWSDDANQRLRRQWENWLWRSLILAVGIHGAIFLFWPAWSASSFVTSIDQDPQVIRLEWIVYDVPPSTQSGILPIAQAGDDGMDAELGGGDDGSAAEAEIRIRERVRELFAEMLPDGEIPVPTTAEHRPATIEEELSQDLLLSASLSMDRLAALQPELALASSWVNWPLIRNPAVVTRFLRTRYDRVSRDDGSETVWVSVAMWVNERGSVEWAEVLDSSGQSEVDNIALDMFKDVAVFLPGHLGGVPSSKSMVISVGFPF